MYVRRAGGWSLRFPDVEAVRAVSERHLKTRWKPVDLACNIGGSAATVRTKLARGSQSIAVCIAEAVSHSFLAACGFRLADAFFVQLGAEFAADLTAQYKFEDRVLEGRHWGTRYMQREVQEIAMAPDMVDHIHSPGDLFGLYLADVVLGNPDRCTFGNVLLAHRPRSVKFDVLPIDQSDAFFHPSAMLSEELLRGRFDASGAEMLLGTERALLAGGVDMVEGAFTRIGCCRGQAASFVDSAAEEWYERAEVDPAFLVEFLEHRIDKLTLLGNKEYWMGLAQVAGGQNVLNLGV